ncbi:DUF1015 domain-containing protein [bacterium]|nr:DUF1015 domain-containing protein [bacterium]
MSDIRPFRGLRPRPDLVDQVASPPYDVLDSAEAREMAAGNPYCFLRVSKAEVDLPPDADIHGEAVYQKSVENFRRMIDQGVLAFDAEPSFYVYRLRMGDHVQSGLVAGVSAQEYEDGAIKKHEHTRREKEDDRARHTEMLRANAGPVLLTYKRRDDIHALIERACAGAPAADFTAPDGIGHTLWRVSDPALVAGIRDAFRSVDAIYIADGHHRSASGYRVRNLFRDRNPRHTGEEAYNFFLATLFPDDELRIMGYHRVVRDLNGLTAADFLARVARSFEVAPAAAAEPAAVHEFGMFLDGRWYRLVAKPGTYPAEHPVKGLDASILQDNLLAPLLGIDDPRTDRRIDFVGGMRGTGELERRCRADMKVAFALYPVSVAQLMAIADAGEVMPPKSTWFEPKLRSGVVVRSLDD